MAKGFSKKKSIHKKKAKSLNKVPQSSTKSSLLQSALVAYQSKDLDLAKAHCQKLIKIDSNCEQAWFLWGNIERDLGALSQAIAVYEKLIEIQPQNISALSNLGVLHVQQRQFNQAITCFNQAIELDSSFAQAHSNLGQLYKDCGHIELAQQHLELAISLDPQGANAYYNLGNVYKHQHNFSEAIANYQTAAKLDSQHSKIHNNLGNTYLELGEVKLACECYQKALEKQSDGKSILDLGHEIYFQYFDSSRPLKLPQNSRRFNSADVIGEHNMLFALNYSEDLTPETIYRNHRNWGSQYREFEHLPAKSQLKKLDPNRPLKIGYVSGDFKTHSVSYFLKPLFVHRDRSSFEIVCYANNQHQDEVTEKLKELVDQWRDIYDLTDTAVVELVRQDQVDILVDLAGHTLGNRLLSFAHKPAPIQVTYLGYPNTTGLKAIDYRFTDAKADPLGLTEACHTEELVRLEHSFLCYQPPNAPQINSLPAITKGYVTFGSFNTLPKVSSKIIDCWIQILRQVPQSRLLIKAKSLQDVRAQERIYELFAAAGIECDRLELRGWMPEVNNHLSLYHEIDIALDTYPYHGTTTTCEALWMGVPVITLAGNTHLSRVGVSLLSNVGLPELITNDAKSYINKAIELAHNIDQLSQLRASLRTQMQASSLMDGPQITQDIESAYRQIWRKFCQANDQIQSPQQHYDRGLGFFREKKYPEAKQYFLQTVSLDPKCSNAYFYLGVISGFENDSVQAIAHYSKAVESRSNFVEARNNLATIYHNSGLTEQAIENYREIIQLTANPQEIISNLLFSLHYVSAHDAEDIYQQHLDYAGYFTPENRNDNYEKPPKHQNKKLKIGYISADFNEHSVAYFIEQILANHSGRRFEVFCYYNQEIEDEITTRFKKFGYAWRNIYQLENSQVIKQIQDDNLDILVDLSGHSRGNRLAVLAAKPAPIQVTYLGYPNTTGLSTVDYRLTDDSADPIGQTDRLHTEKLVRLPHGFLCYRPPYRYPAITTGPVMEKKYITFGSFNNLAKVSAQTIEYWSLILHQVPQSILVIKSNLLTNNGARNRIYQLFGEQGVERERLILQGRIPHKIDHWAAYNQIDIALDTFPYHGTTTTCEALYMGVPVITLAGEVHVSRVGVSILSAVGLPDFIANSPKEYIDKAVALAKDAPRLQSLRQSLRETMQKSSLMDGKQITQDIEVAYRQMWQHYCQQKSKSDIEFNNHQFSSPKTQVNISQSSAKQERFTIFTIHHLSATGGTLISKCLAALPDVVLLSEIHPGVRIMGFNPFDPIQQFAANGLLSNQELIQIFQERISLIVQKCQQCHKQLIIRDHAHSDFLLTSPVQQGNLLTCLGGQYDLKPLITVRNPIDSWLAMVPQNWHRHVETFDNYCDRYLKFIAAYQKYPCFLYEDFVLNPDQVLQKMCDYYGLNYDPSYQDKFAQIRLSGDSGRTSPTIAPRPRRQYDADFVDVVQKSPNFTKVCQALGYQGLAELNAAEIKQ